MRYGLGLGIFVAGIAGGAALGAASPLNLLDPPAKGHHQADHKTSPGHASRFAAGDAHPHDIPDATYHDDAPGPPVGFRGCSWFAHANFGGRHGDTPGGASLGWVGRAMDDRISSIACHAGCRLLASEDINYTGARRTFRGNTADVGSGWNDRISALRVICASDH